MARAVLRAIACLVFWLLAASTAAAQPGPRSAEPHDARLRGRVTDNSGGALPGVSITLSSPSLASPLVIVTDEIGGYASPPLPPGTYSVSFELAGFETRTISGLQLMGGADYVLDRELALAPVQESVEVRGTAPPPPTPPRFDPPPRPQIVPVPTEALASVCGPIQTSAEDLAVGRILGHRDDPGRTLLAHGDVLVLDVGQDVVAPGDNYVVRRRIHLGERPLVATVPSMAAQTSGLIQVVGAGPETSTAVVVYACGELSAGDTVEPFDPLPLLSAEGAGTPVFDDPARIVFAEHGRLMGAPRQLMVIDRGSDHGVHRGQRLTIFRRPRGAQGPLSTVGNAVVVALGPHSATIRVERATDAVVIGDLVALHR